MNLDADQLIGIVTSLMGTLVNATPWGAGVMVLGLAGLGIFINNLIKKYNKGIDAGDVERSGADSGETSVDLKNQADKNRSWMDKQTEDYFNDENKGS